MNAGVRLEWLDAGILAQSAGAGSWVPARSFAPVPDLPNWKTVVPRLGLSYDLLGKGKTVLKASASKYEGVQSVAFAQSVDPMFLTSETCTWAPPPRTTPAMMRSNGVAIVAASTFTKCTGFNGSVSTHLGPTVKCPYSWEYTVQQEIMPQFVVTVGYYYRQNRNNLGIANRTRRNGISITQDPFSSTSERRSR